MKKRGLLTLLALGLVLLGACGAPEGVVTPTPSAVTPTAQPLPGPSPQPWVLTPCRIVDGAETGQLVLAGVEDNQVYLLDVEGLVVTMDGGSSDASALRDGMLVHVGHSGAVLETDPVQFADARSLSGDSGDIDDLCGLYLQVLEDLWAVDAGLNEGITQLGVDFSKLQGLTEGQRSALGYAFGMEHGILPVVGTWEQLRDEGYLTGDPLGGDAPEGARFWHWEEGCLFSIEGNTDSFTAEKWRSSLGAYCFFQCTARQVDGIWTYEIGSEMIS